jgi:hypothetical protein
MKAEIYWLDFQEEVALRLEPLLRKHFPTDLTVTTHQVTRNTRSQALSTTWRYVKLLHAALPPELQLSVGYMEHFGHRVYLNFYFLMFSEYGYSYGYDYNYPSSGTLFDLEYFFPAVALNGRMVLVPRGMRRQVQLDPGSQPFRNLEAPSILETDFADPAALEEACIQIARSLHAEFLADLHAYASIHQWQALDFARVARDLDVSPDFVAQFLGDTGERLSTYRRITCTANRDRVASGRWTRIDLALRNGSEADLPALRLEVAGPVQIRPTRIEVALPAGAERIVPISVLPSEPGEFPLEISLFQPEDGVLGEQLPLHYVWLTCD